MLYKMLLATALMAASLAGLNLLDGAGSDRAFERKPQESAQVISCNYFTKKDFMASVSKAEKTQQPVGAIKGGILPHHLLAGRMIADFFSTLASDPPELLVVLAPNHKRLGMAGLHTSSKNWDTPFGMLEGDSTVEPLLVNRFKAAESTSILEEEYSISGLVPYIKYYLPETRILPVLLHGSYGQYDSEQLGSFLAESLKSKNAIVIASVDFSHYLPVNKADRMDDITLRALKAFDTGVIGNMGNDNLDSPPSIIALLSAMEGMGAREFTLLGHDNSSRITGSGADYTTSYFTAFFTCSMVSLFTLGNMIL